MATINNFEDLLVWQEARILCQLIDSITIKSNYNKYDYLRVQMGRSSGSTMDNIAEGFERGSNKEFIQYLYIAKASCAELRSQLFRSFDFKLIDEKTLSELIAKSKKLGAQIFSFINYLKNSPYKGDKFNNVSEPELLYGMTNDVDELEITSNNQTSNIKPE